jgi:hypothetical protein
MGKFRSGLLLLALAVVLSSCSPERRAILRLTAIGFRDQATIAIEAVRTIYQLRNPARSQEESRSIIVNRILQDKLDFRDVRRVDQIITANQENAGQTNSDLEEAFNDLLLQYEEAAAMLNSVEQVGLIGGDAIVQAAKPARSLTIKMMLLAKRISQNPPSPLDPSRVVISRRLRDLRRRYDSGAASNAERREIQAQVSQQIDEWLRVDAEERRLLCDATTRLLRAAETGQKLSELVDQYKKLSFEEVVATITRTLGTASSLTGRDFSPVITRLQNLDSAIKNDTTLNSIANELRQRPWLAAREQPVSNVVLDCQPP